VSGGGQNFDEVVQQFEKDRFPAKFGENGESNFPAKIGGKMVQVRVTR
jgi:hypothetical protein